MVVRVGHKAPASEFKEQLSRDCVGGFGWDLHGNTARSALYFTVKVAGGGPSVHASAVFFRAKSRDGDKFNQTPSVGLLSR